MSYAVEQQTLPRQCADVHFKSNSLTKKRKKIELNLLDCQSSKFDCLPISTYKHHQQLCNNKKKIIKSIRQAKFFRYYVDKNHRWACLKHTNFMFYTNFKYSLSMFTASCCALWKRSNIWHNSLENQNW